MSIHKITQKEIGEQLKELAVDQVAEVKIKLTRGDVWSRLTDRQGNPVAGASYKLYQGGEVIDEGTTNALGELKVKDLVQGLFKVEGVTEQGAKFSSEVPWLKKGQGPHQQVVRLPMLVEVSWDPAVKEIFPLFYPRTNESYPERGAAKVPLFVVTRGLPDGTPGSKFSFKIIGIDQQGTRHRLPLSLLGIENPAEDMEVQGNILTSIKPGDWPALELRLPYYQVGPVYPAELAAVQVEVTLDDQLRMTMKSAELKRKPPVVIFADVSQDMFPARASGLKVQEKAAAAGHLALIEHSGYLNKPAMSTFESAKQSGAVPMQLCADHLRGAIHGFYISHGNMATGDNDAPCDTCRYRDAWDNFTSDEQATYLAKVLRPFKVITDKAKKTVEGKEITWGELQRCITAPEQMEVIFKIDEARGASEFTPQITTYKFSIRENLSQMMQCIGKGDWSQLTNKLYFCVPSLDFHMSTRLLNKAVSKKLGFKCDLTAAGSMGVKYWQRTIYIAPNIAMTPHGKKLSRGDNVYLDNVMSRCLMGTDSRGRYLGYSFWQRSDGGTFASEPGQSYLQFGCTVGDKLSGQVVYNLQGQHPTPSELMMAMGCLTAASPDLAEIFLQRGTRVFIGNRITVWTNWMFDFTEAFSELIYQQNKTAEQAFNALKGEYIKKLQCKMFVKGKGGEVKTSGSADEYIDPMEGGDH